MKAILNHKWKLLAAIVLVLALVVPMVSVVGAGAANGCTVTVHIPDEVKDVNGNSGYVTFYGDSAKYYDGQTKVVSAGKTVAWYIWVNGKRTPNPGNKQKIDCASDIYVTTAHYCVMEVQIPSNIKNLDESPAYVTIYGIKKNFSDGDKVVLPVCQTIAWYLHINGKRTPNPGNYKHVDCTPLKAGVRDCPSYCKMEINIPSELQTAGAYVTIYGIDKQFSNGETVVLPVCQTITWYLTINGKTAAHTGKHVDCTPIDVTSADYCDVKNETGNKIEIAKGIYLEDGESVLLPTGITIEWRFMDEGWKQHYHDVDCTPIAG